MSLGTGVFAGSFGYPKAFDMVFQNDLRERKIATILNGNDNEALQNTVRVYQSR